MSGALDVNIVRFSPGAINNTARPEFKVPTAGGAISVVAADAVQFAAGTVAVNIVDMGTAGTAVAGTIATLGSAVYVSGTPKAFTIATAAVDAGHWIGTEEKNVGTLDATYRVSVGYVMGK